MNSRTRQFVLPLVIIAVGIGWLLNALNVYSPINWFWTISLASAGLLILLLAGLDRFTAVVGPWLVCAACIGVMRQTGTIDANTEVPLLTIALGVLMFFSRLLVSREPMRFTRSGA